MASDTYATRPPFSHSEDEITGYVDPWVVSPGEKANVKVSSTKQNIGYRTVRLLQGLTWDHAPEPEKEIMQSGPKGDLKGRFQASHPGSYGLIEGWKREPLLTKAADGLEISFYAQPWMLKAPYAQALITAYDANAQTGFAVVIDTTDQLVVWIGTSDGVETIRIDPKLRNQRWINFTMTVINNTASIAIEHVPNGNEAFPPPTHSTHALKAEPKLQANVPLLFAASYASSPSQQSDLPIHFFNGRLDSPHIKALGPRPWTVAKYDFAKNIDTDYVSDVSGSGLDGVLVNAPTRAIRGWDYDHRLIGYNWTNSTYGFGAIHFHEDDLDDAGWETDFTFTVPEDWRSGAYAIEVFGKDSKLKDSIVFFVRPTTVRPQAKTAFVFSTFTYLAYANEHMYDDTKPTHISFPEGVQLVASENYYTMVRRTDLGLAIYDIHSDGSAVVTSSSKRPILNLRPDYIHWGFQRPREFSADLLMVGFLEKLFGDGYDILTDHDLHLRGPGCLSAYDVVISGSHPEYPSQESLDAYEGFVQAGGSLIYAGGNGFYWRSVTDSRRPHRMEVRRADVGARTNELPAGERVHALNGELGGLWRSLGRAPNLLWGIGSCASGKGDGRPFFPESEALNSSSLAWIWKGFSEESKRVFGVKGLAGGASGDELDRLDVAIGSPNNAILVARSERHDDHFMLFNEELIFPMIGTLGSTSPLVRSDIIFYETHKGGNVFSVGSINWNNSLCYDGYQNDIAMMTENVIREFLRRAAERYAAWQKK